MSLLWALVLFGIGLVVVVAAAERLVESTVAVSRTAGVSTFFLSVVLLGFDPENLAVGAVASAEGSAGMALGTIVGAAMVALALALGITALVVPLELETVPRRILGLPIIMLALLSGFALDGRLSRLDGAVLVCAYVSAVGALIYWERQGVRILSTPKMEGGTEHRRSPWQSAGWFIGSLAGVVVGSEVLLRGARPLIEALGWTDTLFGMTLLAVLVSVEEVARELPAAWRGRPEISVGNVVGSTLAFFGCNAGIIALLRPVPVDGVTRQFYLPVCGITVVLIVSLLANRRVPRWGGGLLLLLYVVFVAAPFVG